MTTRLEKARQLKPGWPDERIMDLCPWRFFGWPKESGARFNCVGTTRGETFAQWSDRVCRPCWNKPYKEPRNAK